MTTTVSMTPGAFLRQPLDEPIEAGPDLWGFGGVHGGLTLGLLTSAMQAHAPGTKLRSATARYHQPLRDEFQIETSVLRSGRSITSLTARAVTDAGIHVDATAVFATPRRGSGDWPCVTPAAPAAPPPQDCEIFSIPPEFVPFASHIEIRSVGPNLPFAGGTEPELTAWIRVLEDDDPPDAHRLAFLVDALAPSFAAVLSQPTAVPTIELTVRPSDYLAAASSPWILLRAKTRSADPGGWIDEEIDTWGPDGAHLGSAQQSRFVRAPLALPLPPLSPQLP